MLHRFLNIQDLSAKRKNCLISRVTALLCGTSRRISLDKEKLAFHGITALAGSKLAGKTRARQRALALHAHSGTVGGMTCLRRKHNLVDYRLCLRRVLLKIITQSLAHRTLNDSSDLIVAKLGLCLTFELRFSDLYGNHSCQSVTEVFF